jgi:2-polyprenyl-3-methyl-5-hydroxy-6-metoxy-1,4-benzoquinol methylase
MTEPNAAPTNAPAAAALNADPAELAKFSALAHRWWDPQSEFKPLHDINPLRLGWVERLAGGLAGKRVVVQGLGNVGFHAAKFLHEGGAVIVATRDGAIAERLHARVMELGPRSLVAGGAP